MSYLIVIPAYNEMETIKKLVELCIVHADVCVIDDNSNDDTLQILNDLKIIYGKKLYIIEHKANTHIPRAIQDGMVYAVDKQYDFVITMDAGMSHLPSELPNFINFDNSYDLVIGSRQTKKNVPFYRKIISYLAAKVVNYILSKNIIDILGPKIQDCTSGYRRYSKKAFTWIANTNLKSVAFDFHMESLYICYQKGAKFSEVGITYEFSNSSFNLKVLKQSLRFALLLLKNKFFGI